MSSKRLSPAALLLRNSRLVSMPKPLPVKTPTSLGRYPTHQAITAPTSSLSRGDWGLKRNLPYNVRGTYARALGKYARYDELDTIEHRTTFDSATDFVYSLKKWQEMGIALRQRDQEEKIEVSAFKDGNAWGTRRPHLATLSLPEARSNIKKYVASRRDSFIRWLARIEMHRVRMEKLEGSPDLPPEAQQNSGGLQRPLGRTEATTSLSNLRRDRYVLRELVQQFLKFPAYEPRQTHPSAGLYYTLRDSHMVNDWEHGPGKKRPFTGRDLGQSVYSNNQRLAALGGFVAHVRSNLASMAPVVTRWEPMELRPNRAEIKPNGKIELEVYHVMPEIPTKAAKDLLGDYDESGPKVPSGIPSLTNKTLRKETATDNDHLHTALKSLLSGEY